MSQTPHSGCKWNRPNTPETSIPGLNLWIRKEKSRHEEGSKRRPIRLLKLALVWYD